VDYLDEIKQYQKRKGPSCGVVAAEISAEIRAQFDAAALHPNITSGALAKWLASKGYEISKSTVQRHRRSECRCSSEVAG
jgi:hypothetical protein